MAIAILENYSCCTKYDVFKIKQEDAVFERNFDLGAIAFIAYSQAVNEKLSWEAGLATNNYKLNFKPSKK